MREEGSTEDRMRARSSGNASTRWAADIGASAEGVRERERKREKAGLLLAMVARRDTIGRRCLTNEIRMMRVVV